jgi:hypothetical protein
MYNAGEGNHFEEITIPEGDPGEQLVASLILSIIVCQMYTLPKAIPYITKAYELAMRLESQTITYRPPPHPNLLAWYLNCEARPRLYCFLSSITSLLCLQPVRPSSRDLHRPQL